MREKKFNMNSIMKKLEKQNVAIIEPLCIDCLTDIENVILLTYVNVIFKVEQIEDCLFRLTIIV